MRKLANVIGKLGVARNALVMVAEGLTESMDVEKVLDATALTEDDDEIDIPKEGEFPLWAAELIDELRKTQESNAKVLALVTKAQHNLSLSVAELRALKEGVGARIGSLKTYLSDTFGGR